MRGGPQEQLESEKRKGKEGKGKGKDKTEGDADGESGDDGQWDGEDYDSGDDGGEYEDEGGDGEYVEGDVVMPPASGDGGGNEQPDSDSNVPDMEEKRQKLLQRLGGLDERVDGDV